MSNNDVVIIHLDRPRELKFTHGALKKLVAMTGKSIEELDSNLDVSNFEFLEQMIYCGLLKDAKDNSETLKPEDIEGLLDYAPSFAHQLDQMMEAWRKAFGVTVQKPEGNQQEPATESAEDSPSTGRKANG